VFIDYPPASRSEILTGKAAANFFYGFKSLAI